MTVRPGTENARWGTLTEPEKQMIHHALRVLLTHPRRLPDDEEALAKRLADEIWDEHSEFAAVRSGGQEAGE